MDPRADPLAPGEEDAEEDRLGEEREDALHREGLADHAARVVRELRPVRPELELEWDSRDDAERKVDREDLRPEPRRRLVGLALRRRLAKERQPPVLPPEVADRL